MYPQSAEYLHAACGVGLLVNFPTTEISHEFLQQGLELLKKLGYRGGYNPVTQESDGVGIRSFPLPTHFFNKKIKQGEFISKNGKKLQSLFLEVNKFVVGFYFFPNEPTAFIAAKRLIEAAAKKQGLETIAWRELQTTDSALPMASLRKKPKLVQALFIPCSKLKNHSVPDLEKASLAAAIAIIKEAHEKKFDLYLLSQSAESIVYKGLVKAHELAHFYQDLNDELFTASAIILHTRFATNTEPQWFHAQPCPFFVAHNGEFNSYRSNRSELNQQLTHLNFSKIPAETILSDSTLFDLDLALQILIKNISLTEAAVRLMISSTGHDYSNPIEKMLHSFNTERTPYNGPALILMGGKGRYLCLLDNMGLRPARLSLFRNEKNELRQVFVSSDDCLEINPSHPYTTLEKKHLLPGEILEFTEKGETRQTQTLLTEILATYETRNKDCFLNKLTQYITLEPEYPIKPALLTMNNPDLNRALYAAGWDRESEFDYVYYMAENGSEKMGAMGDDTDPLHIDLTLPIAFFFHPLFAQVTAPPLDSIKERERFSLKTSLGPHPSLENAKCISLSSPILAFEQLDLLKQQTHVTISVLDITINLNTNLKKETKNKLIINGLLDLFKKIEKAVVHHQSNILILSDRHLSPTKIALPDLLAVAASIKHLDSKRLNYQASIIIDSQQIFSPHQAIVLLAMGARAIYPRAAYEKIKRRYEGDAAPFCMRYKIALEKALLKNMGKMGITDVNNYINGRLLAALGLDLTACHGQLEIEPTLGNIFPEIYSPLRGINLTSLEENTLLRHKQAYDPTNNFSTLPAFGHFISQKGGIKHGYGHEIVNAFTSWMKTEKLRDIQWQMHHRLKEKGYPGFIEDTAIFTKKQGFLDPTTKDKSGFYPVHYLEDFNSSPAFKTMTTIIDAYRKNYPTAIRDHFSFKKNAKEIVESFVNQSNPQSQAAIRQLLFSGSMSQGALTVTDPKKPHQLGAHETLTQAMNAIRAHSASGEGGEAWDCLENPLLSAHSKQIASGRFGISAKQLVYAKEVEIKIAQGAKPGEGGELPGTKVSVRFAAQRGGLPAIGFTSPPPHHDIYSIEDLEQLIYDIKSVNPKATVAVKLVATEGIGTISVGVAKAGADIINIASHSGGTGAAQQSSIKHTGFPAELGLIEVQQALLKAKLRNQVKLRISGGFKTAEEILVASIFGANLFEFGTTAMLTLGCKMQRTCNKNCKPGVASDGHLFQGNQIDPERYFVYLAADIQARLKALGINQLAALQGHTELLQVNNPLLDEKYHFSQLLIDASTTETTIPLMNFNEKLNTSVRPKEDALNEKIKAHFSLQKESVTPFISASIPLTLTDRSFPGRITGAWIDFNKTTTKELILSTMGIAGQSYGFTLATGMTLKHLGTVQDGCGKSMAGGTLIICTPSHYRDKAAENTIAGNAMCYGASGGKIFVNGLAGHRFGILLKGAQIVVEGVGDLAFEYMTSGTALIIGPCGKGLCTGAQGGIVFVLDKDNMVKPSSAIRIADETEKKAYLPAIEQLLREHKEQTGSIKAASLLKTFNGADFKVLIPKALDGIVNLEQVSAIFETYQLRPTSITIGMQIWLEQKTLALAKNLSKLNELSIFKKMTALLSQAKFTPSPGLRKKLYQIMGKSCVRKNVTTQIISLSDGDNKIDNVNKTVKQTRPIQERLASIAGKTDEQFLELVHHITSYANQLMQRAQDCPSCRAQSCSGDELIQTGCPAGKPIHAINATLKQLGPIHNNRLSKRQWRTLYQAFELQIKSTPFIAYTGAACPAPCQDGCTETIPVQGKPVNIKEIEYLLFILGRNLGWLDGKKIWAESEITSVFGDMENKKNQYDSVLREFNIPFTTPHVKLPQKLTIVGSGPAAMQLAYEALRDGLQVVLYEKSDKPGGLLVDGIPAHKFDKTYIEEDFSCLKQMGLQLHLNSEVYYDEQAGGYYIKENSNKKLVFERNDENHYLALCLGTGQPRNLPIKTDHVNPTKIIQAVDFLKATNDLATMLKNRPYINSEEREQLIRSTLKYMDPRNKKIVVLGGGDTAQNIMRWIARYFSYDVNMQGDVVNLVRGPKLSQRGIADAYPHHSCAPTPENNLLADEIEFIHGKISHLVEITHIENNECGKLNLQIKYSKLKYVKEIESDYVLKKLFSVLPRAMKPIEKTEGFFTAIKNVDLVICALGFQDESSLFLTKNAAHSSHCYTVATSANSIIEAQTMASHIYQQRIRPTIAIQPTTSQQSLYFKSKKNTILPRHFFPVTPYSSFFKLEHSDNNHHLENNASCSLAW